MRLGKHDGRGIVLLLDPIEAMVLRELPERLRGLLQDPDFTERAVRRILPPGHRNLEDEAEFRALVGADLQASKLARVDAFERSLLDAEQIKNEVSVVLDPETFEMWLGFINDIRLLLGTELDIDEEWDLSEEDEMSPEEELYAFLSWLQGALIQLESF